MATKVVHMVQLIDDEAWISKVSLLLQYGNLTIPIATSSFYSNHGNITIILWTIAVATVMSFLTI